MADTGSAAQRNRSRLSRERVLQTAVAVADDGGIAALTIRTLAQKLGVKPMSLYHYVANKEEILDGIVDMVFSEIELPSIGGDWRSEMRRRARSVRAVLRRHSWAIGLLESRPTPGPASLRHHDVVLGTLRAAGFSREMTAHAYALIDSYTQGFALQEVSLPLVEADPVTDEADRVLALLTDEAYPHLAAMVTEHYLRPGYDFGDEFEFGLSVILDALDASMSGTLPAAGAPVAIQTQ